MVDHGAMKAYSEDLRRKVVEAVQQRGTSKSDASDPIFANITQLEGHGRIIDVCARLA